MRQAKLCRGNGRKRSSDDAMGSLEQNLLSNQFSATNSFPSLWTPPKKDLPEIADIIPALFMICSFLGFFLPSGCSTRLCRHGDVHTLHRAEPPMPPPLM